MLGHAEPLRLATFNTELARDGPGLFVRDLAKGGVEDIEAVLDTLVQAAPDVILLLDIDNDFNGVAVQLLQATLAARGLSYAHVVAAQPNTGLRSGLDLNGDGRVGDPQDAQGFGEFPGQGGMVLLSRLPLGPLQDHSAVLWRDVSGADPPLTPEGAAFPTPEAFAVQRLAAVAHWQVPVIRDGSVVLTLTLLHASAPVFDGPEDRNGRRNADELAYAMATLPPGPVAVMGTLNLDPFDSDGRLTAIRTMLANDRLQDAAPRAPQGRDRAQTDGGTNGNHRGDPELDTADWQDTGPGNLRVDYVLPDAKAQILGAGLIWPRLGRRALVWVDLVPP